MNAQQPAQIHGANQFFNGASGRWATERLLAALRDGRDMSPRELRTNDALRHEDWINFDRVVVEEMAIRLRGVADLVSRNLIADIPNAFGKTLHQWTKVTDMDPAQTSLDGLARTDNDRHEFDEDAVPLPITHKDFNLSLRHLAGSRNGQGEPLDTTHVRTSARLVAEQLEKMLFQGGPTYLGKTIYGYTTHPNRNTGTHSVAHWDDLSTTIGATILADVLAGRTALRADRAWGPYGIYVPANYDTVLENDSKAESEKTIRERILAVDGIEFVTVVDQMTADEWVMVQLTPDVVQWGMGEAAQTIQWDAYGGMQVDMKVFAVQVPILKADASGRSGIYHCSGT